MSTTLDIMNAMLIAGSEAPVSSEDSLHPSALQAKAWFNRANKEFQSRGWWFNQEYDMTLTPDPLGNIVLPGGTLKCVVLTSGGLIRRSGKLYDPYNHTYTLEDPVQVNLTLQIEPDDLPPAAVNYLTARCVYDYYMAEGAGDQDRKYSIDVVRAWAELCETELTESKVSVYNHGIPLALNSRIGTGNSSGNPNYPGGRA